MWFSPWRPSQLDSRWPRSMISIPLVRSSAFRFLAPGGLADRELELVVPQKRWVDDLLAACRHPLTLRDAPEDALVTREKVDHFLSIAPYGREPADPKKNRVPAYHFWMMLRHG